MSVHNSVHNSEHGDDYIENPDPVTLISKLDISDPLHLHPNDTTALTVVSIKLKGTENYQVWSCAMLLALEGKNETGFIDGTCKRSNTDEVLVECSVEKIDAMIELPKCVCNASEGFKKHNQLMKLMQFLMGLDDSYMRIRSSIIFREVLHDFRSAYATISSEESHRVVAGSIVGSSKRNQVSAFVSNKVGGFALVCENCGFNGHTIDRCFKIIGYPADFGKKKSGQNVKGKNISNNNSVGSSSSSGFTDEQMATLISLIKDNKIGKNVQINMADVNHINFFDVEYPEMPNDDERVDTNLNNDQKSQSDSSNSSVSGSDVNTADFPVVNPGNDAYSSDDIVATQNEEVATLEENIFSKELPKDRKAIGSKWIYKIKYRSSREIDRYKSRLVAQSFGQKEGIDYEDTFSPVVKMVTVRCLLNVVVSNDWPVFELDVNNASLYGDLVETVYMRPPEGYFPLGNKGVFLALLVYVDDIIITGNNVSEIEKCKVFLKSKFMIKDLGKLKYFLGIEVIDTDKVICLNQRKYVLDLLSDYGMLACKPAKTPLMSKLVISNEASDNDPILDNITDYQKLMDKLIYLTNTRPYISYVVHCLRQFMHSPLKSYLKIAFKKLRYLKSCPGLGIHIIKNSGMSLNAYSDADWAKCIVTRRSVT
ncbi:ribonuclease H-like domain-containing protein [Tanacetum coccineum]|uniref:Ribonuclease H-like domain-containing protein n=1 Tax=Tanacetum coccineum TaxID=301880 RepID=A0ABQ5BYF0_9ASTR